MFKNQPTLWVIVCFLAFSSSKSQVNLNSSGNLENQFNTLIQKSDTYGQLKVVKISELYELKENVSNSILTYDQKLKNSLHLIQSRENQIDNLKQEITTTKFKLEQTQNSPTISVLGVELNKSLFNFIFGLILISIIGLVFFYRLKFKDMNETLSNSKEILSDLEDEYEDFRRKAIEREQKIKRQLQDYINKQKQFETSNS